MTSQEPTILAVIEAARSLVQDEAAYQLHFDSEIMPSLPTTPPSALARTRELHQRVMSSVRRLVEVTKTYDASVQEGVAQIGCESEETRG